MTAFLRTLAGLNEKGLVDMEVIEREERLDMKIYHITQAGSEELHRWLSTPIQSPDYREPFLIQLYFGGTLSDDELVALLQYQIRAVEETLSIYAAMYSHYQKLIKTHGDPRTLFLSVTTLEYGIMSNQSALEWLKNLLERVQAGDYTPQDFQISENNES